MDVPPEAMDAPEAAASTQRPPAHASWQDKAQAFGAKLEHKAERIDCAQKKPAFIFIFVDLDAGASAPDWLTPLCLLAVCAAKFDIAVKAQIFDSKFRQMEMIMKVISLPLSLPPHTLTCARARARHHCAQRGATSLPPTTPLPFAA